MPVPKKWTTWLRKSSGTHRVEPRRLKPAQAGGPETAGNDLDQCAGRVGRMALRSHTGGPGGPSRHMPGQLQANLNWGELLHVRQIRDVQGHWRPSELL